MGFRDKVAIVAGGGGGIGQGIAEALGAEGAKVVIWDVNEAGAKDTEKRIKEKGGQAYVMKVDVLKYDETKAAVDQVVVQFGQVDILVTTVGGGPFKPFKDYTPEFWRKQMEYNADSTFNCCHAVIGPMIKRNYGRILVLNTGAIGMANLAAYGAGKAASKSLVETLAAELAPNNITANSMTPGLVLTPLTTGAYAALPGGDKILEQTIKSLPWGANTPENVAKLALYLVSDDAARVTGQTVNTV